MQPILAATEAALSTTTSKGKGKPSCRTRGPYQDRDKWRLTFIEEGKKPWSEIYETRAAALAAQRAFHKRQADKSEFTVGNLMARYVEFQMRKGSKDDSVRTAATRLRMFFGYTELMPLPVAAVTPDAARAAYDRYTRRLKPNGEPIAVATHQEDLNIARCMYTWAVEEKLASSNPFLSVRPIGRKNRGKHQHTADEAGRFLDVAYEHAVSPQAGYAQVTALAVCIIVGTGARPCEVMKRRVRDLDEGGTKLHARVEVKNEHSKRTLRIPSKFVPLVLALASGRPPDALLFAPDSDGGPAPSDQALRKRPLKLVKQLCEKAGVDVVVTHSFRGLWATLGVAETGDADLVARRLGHGSTKTTNQNYIDHRVAGVAQQERIQARLGMALPGPGSPMSMSDLTAALERLTEQLDVAQMQKLVQHLVGLITAKAAGPALKVGSKPIQKRLPARSKSNTEQVGGFVRNLSAGVSAEPFSVGE